MFKEYFKFESPTDLTKQLFETKNENKNNDLVNVIKSGLIDLKKEIEKASEEEIEIEKPDEIVKFVEEILEFNRQASKRVVQKTAEATEHLIGNKISDKITSICKPKEK